MKKNCNCADGNCKCGFLGNLPPNVAFLAGMVLTAAAVFGVGFVIVLAMMFQGVELTFPESDTTANSNTNVNTNVKADDTVNTNVAKAAGTVDPESLSNLKGSGDITIIEYSDIECPFCKMFHTTMIEVMPEYEGKVAWAYKHLPLKSLHQNAEIEAIASECAAEQGKFWEYLDTLYETTTSNDGLAEEEMYNIATNLGLDRTKFDDCLESEKYLDRVTNDSKEAQSLGGTGTPFSVIIDSKGNVLDTVSGALPADSIKQVLDTYVN